MGRKKNHKKAHFEKEQKTELKSNSIENWFNCELIL